MHELVSNISKLSEMDEQQRQKGALAKLVKNLTTSYFTDPLEVLNLDDIKTDHKRRFSFHAEWETHKGILSILIHLDPRELKSMPDLTFYKNDEEFNDREQAKKVVKKY